MLISNPRSSIIQGLEQKIKEKEKLIYFYEFTIEHYNDFVEIIKQQ